MDKCDDFRYPEDYMISKKNELKQITLSRQEYEDLKIESIKQKTTLSRLLVESAFKVLKEKT